VADDLVVNVDLDTKGAKSQYRELTKKAARRARSIAVSQARKVSGGITGLGGIPSFGIGALTGYAAVGRILSRGRRGPVDPWTQLMVPYQAMMQEWLDKKLGYNASARMDAIRETSQKMGVNAHFMKETDSAKQYYKMIEPAKQLEYQGLQLLRMTMKGPDFDEVVVQALKGYGQLIENAFSWWWQKLTG
jgi:hypothetical protein